ncbi:hypothetical protein [Glutamicibacter sp. NPDC087583]|uniref:hypothetical protein n=1 Tax=Glutamicibacter sp. NPDC087583 TaxID=3363995 RepID=UPI0037F69636
MAKVRIRVELNHAGIRNLARSAGMQNSMVGVAEKVAATAGPGFIVKRGMSRNRARAAVVASNLEAIQAEQNDRALTRAISAGKVS